MATKSEGPLKKRPFFADSLSDSNNNTMIFVRTQEFQDLLRRELRAAQQQRDHFPLRERGNHHSKEEHYHHHN